MLCIAITTHIDEVSIESLLQVVQEGVHISVVLQEHKVLHSSLVPGMKCTLYASPKRLAIPGHHSLLGSLLGQYESLFALLGSLNSLSSAAVLYCTVLPGKVNTCLTSQKCGCG